MSASRDTQDKNVEAMDRCQEAADQSLRAMSKDAPREITFEVTPDFYDALEQLMHATRQNLGDVFTRAIALYKTAVDLKRQGKHVGVADEGDNLVGEFVGLGPPDSGL